MTGHHPERVESYHGWLEAKVSASLADDRPPIPHEAAMEQVRAIIARYRGRQESTLTPP
ncbi:MAG: hypothetical protein V4574_20685 [Pseudomonadota bacterium]